MKLATFIHQGGEQVGLVDADAATIRPVSNVATVLDYLRQPVPLQTGQPIALTDVLLAAPIPRPARSILCVGKNYREHAQEFARSGFDAGADQDNPIDAYPAIFSKLASTVVGPFDAIERHPTVTRQLDYEGELAVIIGRQGRGIGPADAHRHVWGYCIINDVTARDLQKQHRQWDLGKSLDTFCPMGPWLTSADEVDPAALQVQTLVNGQQRQQGRVSDLIFPISSLLATLSAGITLYPGDIIATGTPAGVGIGMTPPQFLQAGDVVEVRIDGLGAIRNTVR